MAEHFVVPELAGDTGVANLFAFVSRLLLGWYLREVRHVEVPEDPREAIVTYPLA